MAFSREAAAVQMDTSADTLRKWENGREPLAGAYPKIIAFLGYEPWPAPETLAQRLRCARLRKGLTIREAAVDLGVDDTTVWWWEGGRKVHRLADRARIDLFIGGSPSEKVKAAREAEPEPRLSLGQMLRTRRAELNLTQEAAAEAIGADTYTLLHWEHDRHAPSERFYPALIAFLGREPWPTPHSVADQLRAERLRRGWSREQLSAVLQVDPGSLSKWEAGDGPHHALSRAKVKAFLSGKARPRKRR